MPRNPLHTMLRLALAFVWVWTGLVVLFLYPLEESLALMAPLGLPERAALLLIWVTALFEIVMGALMAANWRVRLWAAIQIGLMVAFTVILTVISPELWLQPYGPLSKNVPLVAATIVLLSWETEKERQRKQLFSFHSETE